MAAIGMPMPSLALPGPSSASASVRPASPVPLQSQGIPQKFSSPNHASQGLSSGVSGLSLALPLAASQSGGSSNAMPIPISGTSTTACQGGSGMAYAFPAPSEPPFVLPKIKLADILPEDGAPSPVYLRAVEGLSNSLARHSAVILELSTEDAALVRCALESSKLYFRTRAQSGGQPWGGAGWSKATGYVSSPSRDMYYYRAGRFLQGEDEQLPPCMSDVFRCLGKASRTALGAISRHLGLRSDAFNSLLDDCPLPSDEVSSSVVVATHFHTSGSTMKGSFGGDSHAYPESEKGFLMLIASDTPGLQVCDPIGHWYPADNGLQSGDLLMITGRSLNHVSAGLCRPCTYRVFNMAPSGASGCTGRTSLTFRLMPRGNAMLDGSLMADAGHTVPECYGPVSVAQFMEGLTAAEALVGNGIHQALEVRGLPSSEPSLRSVLSDPLTGVLLEDAFTAPGCGHSFGGATLRRVSEARACNLCGASIELERLIPNLALRSAAAAFKREECRRQLQNANRKRRKELGDQGDRIKRLKECVGSMTSGEVAHHMKGVQYPFSVNERVLIKGNKRTPEKFMGREAVITSQCLNGWYLLKTLDNGESVRLQYRSLQKLMVADHSAMNDDCVQHQHNGQVNS
eukprot:c27928_g3_i1 orf=306-2195(+)